MTWEIFFADSSNIYLITQNYVAASILETKISEYNGTSDFYDLTKYPAVEAGWLSGTYNNGSVVCSSGQDNIKSVQYLLDSTKWADYEDTTYADYAIGAPTLDMLSASLVACGKDAISYTVSGNGYTLSNYTSSGSLPTENVWNRGTDYWLAYPYYKYTYYVGRVHGSGGYIYGQRDDRSCGFRPIVCLNSKARLTLNETTGNYEISMSISK